MDLLKQGLNAFCFLQPYEKEEFIKANLKSLKELLGLSIHEVDLEDIVTEDIVDCLEDDYGVELETLLDRYADMEDLRGVLEDIDTYEYENGNESDF